MSGCFFFYIYPKKQTMHRQGRTLDLLSAGELLIDFISTDFAETFDEVSNFKRLQGGSPANFCMNLARLGKRTALVASVGTDDMGDFLVRSVAAQGVDTAQVAQVAVPTTLILVTRSKTVSNFEAYRSADCEISEAQFPEALLREVSVFHTTCFGLSREPARGAILGAAARAAQGGAQLSIDANYAAKIWPDREEAQAVVAAYCAQGAIVKISEVDWERLYGSPLQDAAGAAAHFLALGAAEVCVTMGGEGCYVAKPGEGHFLPARPVEVKDTTGAGDAFWSGYLCAWLDGRSLLDCARAGRRMAEIKLGHFGHLPGQVARELIYEEGL